MRSLMQRIREWGNRTVKVKWVVPAYAILAGVILLGGNAIAVQNSDDLEQNARADAVTAYTDCVRRVDTREDLRDAVLATPQFSAAMWDAVLSLIPDQAKTVTARAVIDETTATIVAEINEKYPALSLDTCGDPPTA